MAGRSKLDPVMASAAAGRVAGQPVDGVAVFRGIPDVQDQTGKLRSAASGPARPVDHISSTGAD
jgi:carboxylesterase type B